MILLPDYLRDKEFLKKLDYQKQREVFASVVALNYKEEVIEEISGRVSTGSVSIDGKSSVRRTCNLTLVAEELNIHEYYWGLKTKFRLAIGVKNEVDSKYPDICWFQLGTYVISSFNTSQATNNYTVSIQGKDKMAMLNGDLGGTVTALSHDFGKLANYSDDGSYSLEEIPLKQIIIDTVHTFANEPLQNIIVNDLDESGVELMEYRGEKPLFMLYNEESNEVEQMTIYAEHGRKEYQYKQWNKNLNDYPSQWSGPGLGVGDDGVVFNTLAYDLDMDKTIHPTLFKSGNKVFSIIKIERGETAGYRVTNLTYPGDLIVSVGTSVTTGVLDKIKNMLGDFEYFYDVDGRFVFQRKKTFVNVSWNNEVKNEGSETYYDNLSQSSSSTYYFEDSQLVTSFSNSPALANLRNDFSIWGERQSATGATIPIHLRYAIDKKPSYYTSYDGTVTYTSKTKEEVDLDIKEGDIEVSMGYIKTKNPVFASGKEPLPEEWWDAYDWAEYYKKCTGAYPKLSINNYTESGAKVDIYNHFDNQISRYDGSKTPITQSKVISSDTIFTKENCLYDYHGSCVHFYGEHLMEWQAEGQQIFVYKPDLPEDIKSDSSTDLIPIGSSVKYELDWRELIYQMAVDYMKFGREDDFLQKIAKNNTKEYPLGYTGYEQYYTDILGFWRELYNPTYWASFKQVYVTKTDFDANKVSANPRFYYPKKCSNSTVWSDKVQFLKKVDPASDRYEPATFTKESWDSVKDKSAYFTLVKIDRNSVFDSKNYYYEMVENEYKQDHWHRMVYESPHMLNFWFDFLDSDEIGELGQFSVKAVGARPKAENDNAVKAIYFRDTPNVIFVDASIDNIKLLEMKEEKAGYSFARLPGYFINMFSISAQGKSTFDVLNSNLYNYSYCTETISLNTLPVYYLEPNTRIFVKDDNSGINGEYIIERLTIPLQYNGTMSISATKATERLY